MNEIIEKILIESGYTSDESFLNVRYYTISNNTFFFLLNINENEIQNLKQYSEFEKISEYVNLKESFNSLAKSGNSNGLQKNSSLIISVRCKSITAIETLKQQILMIEEDEYFFKKYVIIYSDESIAELQTAKPLIPYLQSAIQEKDKFNSYAFTGLKNSSLVYLTILQLFIKLPFLKLTFSQESYKSLKSKINEKLGEELCKMYDLLIEKQQNLLDLKFDKDEDEAAIDEVIKLLQK